MKTNDPPERGLYFIRYSGPEFAEPDGTRVVTGACKVGQQKQDLTTEKVRKRYSDHVKRYGGVATDHALEVEILCRIRDRDDLDALEKLTQEPFKGKRLKSGRGSPKEWMKPVEREEVINSLLAAFRFHFHICPAAKQD